MAWRATKNRKKRASFSDQTARKISAVGWLFMILGGLILVRLFFIQVLNSDYYKALADRQHQPSETGFSRGSIFFKEKNGNLVFAAGEKQGFFLAVNPALLESAQSAFQEINSIVEINKEEFLKRASKSNDPFEEIIHRLNPEQARAIESLGLKGVGLYPESWRYYPAGNLASHVLGFVGFEGDKLTGRYGIERFYEEVLTGQKEKIEEEGILEDIFSSLSKKISGSAEKGNDIALTIEPQVQAYLENQLEEIGEKWQGQSSGGLILNPETGEIIALAKKPDFNPNQYGQTENLSLFINPLVEHIFEMGSVFKPLTLAAGLNEGKISEETVYNDAGYVVFNNARIENFDGKARGKVNMQEVLNQSLNTGAVFVMEKLGQEKFFQYLKNYGLDEKTGIDLPNETKGNFKNFESGREIEFATASFGQGIALSPLGFSVALASLANGGKIIKPYVAERIIAGGESRKFEPEIEKTVLSSETSERISRMLSKTVDQALLGGTIKLKNYTVAAKTGTAQILNPETGEYYEDQNLHSFFGYAPAFDAQFLVFLYLEKPQGVRYASQSLGTPFMDIIKFLLNYYEIPPDR